MTPGHGRNCSGREGEQTSSRSQSWELTRLVLGTVTMEQCLLETSDLAGASADHTTVGRSCSTPHQHPSMVTSRSLEQVTWVLTLTWDWSTTDQMLTTHMTWTRRHQLRVNIVRSQTHRELVWNLLS